MNHHLKRQAQFKPNSPYSASKASVDHICRSYYKTFGFPVTTTNCSNNYGPFQLPEKLIPLIIYNSINNRTIPVYGDGKQVRDWLHVEDHCDALRLILEKGKIGETYNIGGNTEITNIDVIKIIIKELENIKPSKTNKEYYNLIKFVKDRPGHDFRYAIDISKISVELNWNPKHTITGIRDTILWYIKNIKWSENGLILN